MVRSASAEAPFATGPELPRLLHVGFERQARRTPDTVALYYRDRSIDYAELDLASRKVSSAMRARGVRDGSMVGLYVDRSIDWVIAILAILRSGAAVVPLPPGHPHGRLAQVLGQTPLDATIDSPAARLAPDLTRSLWHLDDLLAEGSRHTDVSANPGHPEQAAFVLSSSGSTGQPKMIVRSHRSFFHRLTWTWNQHPYGADEVCCQKAHMTTTHSIYELFEPLLTGTPQVILPDDAVRNLEVFWEAIKTRNVTRLLIVPSAMRASLDMAGFVPPPLEVLVLMGEYLDPSLAERVLGAFPSSAVYSIYGSTEASSTLVCDLHACYRQGEELPLGSRISDDVETFVLSSELQPVSPGETGRLHVAGGPLFSEYLGDRALTDTALVRTAWHPAPLYDTKDDVKLMPDTSIRFVGRVDNTVKIRGFRVNTDEVERSLGAAPTVTDAAVVVTERGSAGAGLVAFVCPSSANRDEVYRTLREQLPDYMVPSSLVALDALPLTSSGKVDRVRLAEQRAKPALHHPRDAARSPIEEKVVDVWRSVLGHDDFSLDNSFFEVGGTSLTVFVLVQRLREAFGFDRRALGEQDVYRFPSVETLTRRIETLDKGTFEPIEKGAPLVVRLRKGKDSSQSPFFVVASAGGTLGAYAKLAQALDTPRDVVGVRDPFIWGERDPREDFRDWVGHYLEAILQLQPTGPYYLGAYSSAGAFGYELALELHERGHEVALLALIDPLMLDNQQKSRFGYWISRSRDLPPVRSRVVRRLSKLYPALRTILGKGHREPNHAGPLSQEEFEQLAWEATHGGGHIVNLSALFELNTSLPFALFEADLEGKTEGEYLGVLKERASRLTPEVDASSIERIAVQYKLQVRAQTNYRLRPYDGNVLLVEPAGPYAGLVAAQLKPHVPRLRTQTVAVGAPSDRVRTVSSAFQTLATHYRTMRDDTFVSGLAQALATPLG